MRPIFVKSAAGAVLAAFLLMVGAPAMAADALSNPQKEEVRKLVREYLLQNPEVIRDAIDALQAKEEKETQAKQQVAVKKNKDEIFSTADGTIIGNPKGDVTLVEFFDYNCGYCKQMFPAMLETLKQDGKVRLIVKEFPILGAPSVMASRAALAARKQNKYVEFHTALMSHKGALTEGVIFQTAKDVGLDSKKLEADMKAPEVDEIIKANHKVASDLNIEGTPAMFVGETFVNGAVDKTKLAEMIASARK